MDVEKNLPIHNPDAGASLDSAPVIEDNDAKKTEELEKKRKRTNIFTIIVMVLICLSFGFQGLAIGFNTDSLLIIISGIIACVVTGTVAVKQIMMQRMDTLRAVHNKIRMEVNRFMEENNLLTRNVNGLEDQVIKLEGIERELESIAEEGQLTADELVSLVKENGAILKEQQALAKADLQEQLLTTVLKTDRDGNLKIEEREATVLILRMKNYGVEFDEKIVRESLLQTQGSVPSLLKILREIGAENEEKRERLDAIDETKEESTKSLSSSKRLIQINDTKFMESVKSNYSKSSLFDASKNSLLDD